MAKKIFLDTDIGSDIDDVICLTYLLNNPDCELLGITTVTGEPEKRAKIARNLCFHAGKCIPVISGKSDPLIISQHQPIADEAKIIEDWVDATISYKLNAIDFMRKTIRENPYEVTLLAIGPLTNIALLFLIDPEIPSLLESLVMMCGSFLDNSQENLKIEWNALCDPHAAAIVYQTPIKKHYSIGLDVTQKVTMRAEEFRKIFSNAHLGHILNFAEVWLEKEKIVTFHDPLAAAVVFEPELIGFTNGIVQVETCCTRTMGFTDFIPEKTGPHSVATDINVNGFFSHFFNISDKGYT